MLLDALASLLRDASNFKNGLISEKERKMKCILPTLDSIGVSLLKTNYVRWFNKRSQRTFQVHNIIAPSPHVITN